MLLTVALTLIVNRFVHSQQQLHFSRDVQTYERELNQRLQNYGNALNATRALWESSDDISGLEFGRFVTSLDLPVRYPGLISLGYAPFITAGQLPDFLAQLRVQGVSGPAIRPAGLRPLYVPVQLLIPDVDGNSQVIGYDMYSEPLRRAAIDAARGSGLISSTRRVTLLTPQGARNPAGLLLYAPVFRDGQLRGLAYAPLSLERMLPGLGGAGPGISAPEVGGTGAGPQRAQLDGPTPAAASGEAAAPGGRAVRAVQVTPPPPAPTLGRLQLRVSLAGERLSGPEQLPTAFQEQDRLRFAGQDWVLDFAADRDFGRDASWLLPWAALLMGTLVALAAALEIRRQVEARLRAEQVSRVLAESRSALERARAEFEAIFRAIQDTAIFTDPAGQVLFTNPAVTRTFGLEPQQLRGTPLGELYADPQLAAHLSGQPGAQLLTTPFRRRALAGSGEPGSVGGGAAERGPAETGPVERGPGGTGDAHTFYGEMQRSPVLGEGGELLGQLTVVRDISERLRADSALRGSERRAQGVLEAMPQIVWLTGAQGLHFTLNRRWAAYVGEERKHRSFLELVHPQDRAEFSHRFAEAVARGGSFESEHRLLSASGEYRTFVSRGRPLSQVVGVAGAEGWAGSSGDKWAGSSDEWVGTSTDIEDQVYSEMTSRLLADFTQRLTPGAAPATPSGTPDLPGELEGALALVTARYADAALLWLAELDADPASGGDADRGAAWGAPLLHARGQALERGNEPGDGRGNGQDRGRAGLPALPQVPEVSRALAAVRASGEAQLLRGEALHAQALGSLLLLPLPPGSPLGVLGLGFRQQVEDRQLEVAQELALRLMTALDNRVQNARTQAAQQALQELNNSLEVRVAARTSELSAANSELEAFSYSVSHDLRTPLRHIAGFGDLLRKELEGAPQSAKAQRYLGIIASSAERMNTLIDDLLEFSRTSRAELQVERVEPDSLLRALLREAQPDLAGRDVQVQLTEIPAVRGDSSLLRQVFANLLSNALKYTRTRECARVEVRGERRGDEVVIRIQDNGVGFDPQYASRLFGVFQRLHRAEEFEGTGIGLANVRRVVQRHQGRVWAESGWTGPGEAGEGGASFFVALPAADPQREQLPEHPLPAVPAQR